MNIAFSHGFGVDKTDRGLFTDIAKGLGDSHRYIMFEYNEIDDQGNMTVPPFSAQVKKLQAALKEAEGDPVLICHSQGCVIAALAKLKGYKIIMLAPAMNFDLERLVEHFSKHEGTIIDPNGTSKLARSDGSTTLVGADYVAELVATRPVEVYPELIKNNDVLMVKATQDEVLGDVDYGVLGDVEAKVIDLPADHNFTGSVRQELIELIRKEISD